jgi:hypothetical protein
VDSPLSSSVIPDAGLKVYFTAFSPASQLLMAKVKGVDALVEPTPLKPDFACLPSGTVRLGVTQPGTFNSGVPDMLRYQ